ncbi:MAG: AEC family transporter [Piscinibacter sp.]|uniref:AEC family transporter n=1 Tax=Piscinibacter TaxID=1114981 RepID=UPI000FDED8A0|nr:MULTISPECIES: AEC family transporter [Piscinibacter]MCW5665726.1 AEC family transporter [Piscinibacter sp.]
MSNLLLLVACLAAGLLLRHSGRMPEGAHTAINAVILHLSLPALTLHHLHAFRFDAAHLLPVLMPWALFLLGAVLFRTVGRLWKLPAASIGALTLVGGFGNTSFVGLPMIEALHGRDGLGLGLLIDQLGSYLALSTLGIAAAALYSGGGGRSAREVLLQVLRFPPFVALVLALVSAPLAWPPAVDQVLLRIGDTLAPLALLSVGLQLRFDALREHARLLCLGLGYKLLACPALVLLLLWWAEAAPGTTSRVSVIEAAMPPMIGAAIVAAQARLAPPLVSLMVGLGIPLGLSTAPAWHWLGGRLLG